MFAVNNIGETAYFNLLWFVYLLILQACFNPILNVVFNQTILHGRKRAKICPTLSIYLTKSYGTPNLVYGLVFTKIFWKTGFELMTSS